MAASDAGPAVAALAGKLGGPTPWSFVKGNIQHACSFKPIGHYIDTTDGDLMIDADVTALMTYKDDHSDLAALKIADIIPHHDLGNYKMKLATMRDGLPPNGRPITVLVVNPPELTSDAVITFERLTDGKCVFNIFGNNLWNLREVQVIGLNEVCELHGPVPINNCIVTRDRLSFSVLWRPAVTANPPRQVTVLFTPTFAREALPPQICELRREASSDIESSHTGELIHVACVLALVI